MLIEPKADRLLARICESLERTALADMMSPYAHRQLKAGLWALRDLASSLKGQGEWLEREVADMKQVLAAHADCRPKPLPGILPYASLEEQHLALQDQLATLDAHVQATAASRSERAGCAVRELRALYVRMLERERAAKGAPEATTAGSGA